MITRERNLILQGTHGRPFLADVYFQPNGQPKPIVIFSHGFKGFKDWGAFDLVAESFAQAGLVFVKFNFSHNGTTIDHPLNFADLEAFGNDNISIALEDLKAVMDWTGSADFPATKNDGDLNRIYLLGHSRGGGISILKAREDERVKKLCTWGSINEFGKFWTEETMETLKNNGVIFIPNARTQQMMPIKWQMYEDYQANRERLYIPDAVRELTIPFLIIHGTNDETVPVAYAQEMKSWRAENELLILENGNHSFGAKHPWEQDTLPDDLQHAVQESIRFFKR